MYPRAHPFSECTAGVSPDVEAALYDRCSRLGMAVLSISHKLELRKMHDFELKYLSDGKGGYEFTRIDH